MTSFNSSTLRLPDFLLMVSVATSISSDSDLRILIITSSSENIPGPVNVIHVADAKYKSSNSNKYMLKPAVTRA